MTSIFDLTEIFKSINVNISEIESIKVTITPDNKDGDLQVGQEVLVRYKQNGPLVKAKIVDVLSNGDIDIELEF